MKKTSKKKEVAKKGEVCVPSRFPDASSLLKSSLKTGVKAGYADPPDGGTPSPGTCPGKVHMMNRVQ